MADDSGTMDDQRGISRRELIKRAGVGAGGLALSSSLAAPAWARPNGTTRSAANTIKLGFISPITGPAAGFGEGDAYIIGLAKKGFAKGLKVAGTTYDVEITSKDSQSSPSRCAQVANDLIHGTGVDLLLATSTPESVNPAADAAEANRVPSIATIDPWQSWYFGRGAKPGKPSPFKYSFCFSFGGEDFGIAYTSLWPQVKTNKRVGVMWPNDADGNAFRESLGPALEKAGYKVFDPGAYQDGTTDYTKLISVYKKNNCQIFQCAPIPPDFTTLWRQAGQQGYTSIVKIAQLAKTGLFPSQVSILGKLGPNLASGAYWTPHFPYPSPLTGLSAKKVGDGYTAKTGRQWNQQLGASLALFDVAAAALKASGDPKNKDKVAQAMFHLKATTPLGHLHWGAGGAKNPVANVVRTPIIGGQWRKSKGRFPLDFLLCEHADDPKVPVQSKLVSYS